MHRRRKDFKSKSQKLRVNNLFITFRIVICTNKHITIIQECPNKIQSFELAFNCDYIAYSFDSKLLAYQRKDFNKVTDFIVCHVENKKEAIYQFEKVHKTNIVFIALNQNGSLAATVSNFVL